VTGGAAKRYFIGLDLGMCAEPTALAVLERRRVEASDRPEECRPGYSLRHLIRFPVGTSYPAIIDEVTKLLRTPPLPGAWLLVDYTIVGRAVLRLFRDSLAGRVTCQYSPVALTAGHDAGSPACGGFLIAKRDLVGTLQALLQTRRLQVASEMPHARLLTRELENYRTNKKLPKGDELMWREGDHDDLVLAVALAAWGGEHALPSAGPRR
jgi:hypothetical protein